MGQLRVRLSRPQREEQLVSAARALFGERGYAGVTMDDVARAVGVTKPLLYAYFGNKERLFLACLEPAAEELVETVVDAVAAAEDPAQALELGVHAFFAFVDRNRDSWRVLFDDTVPPSGQLARWVGDHRDRIETMVARALLARMPARRRQRAAVEVEALSVALLAASEALARWWVRTGALSAAQAADLLVTTIEPGLRARATGQGAAA